MHKLLTDDINMISIHKGIFWTENKEAVKNEDDRFVSGFLLYFENPENPLMYHVDWATYFKKKNEMCMKAAKY